MSKNGPIKIKILSEITIQKNGIIKDKSGVVIGTLNENVNFEKIDSKEILVFRSEKHSEWYDGYKEGYDNGVAAAMGEM